MRVLVVSSFVTPHLGGVERFVATTRALLQARGHQVQVLACRLPYGETHADVALPTLFLPRAEWPVPIGGWRQLWREVGAADVVLANGARQLLPVTSALAARARGKGSVLVLHGGNEPVGPSLLYHRALGSVFERLLARPALHSSLPVAPSRSGVVGARTSYGVEARFLPFPLPELPAVSQPPRLAADEPVRIVFSGRLFPEKDPVTAVHAVERLRQARPATLDVYGGGPLRTELAARARGRSWLQLHNSRSWQEIQGVYARAHVCLSTSRRDAAQLAVLEALCRGIPVVSTEVGDAPDYYLTPELRRFCVPPGDPAAIAKALLTLAGSYEHLRAVFAENGRALLRRHSDGAADELVAVLEDARRRPSSAAGR